ncbi:lycopene cyclase domain-containing protein [Aquimarina sp. BL5]|uniref:lycopene cyclase domain-containing protein n=1 Tax=Aquimarina sp. BL5 TaxID=1714860 RepID=UPI000E54C634|nr:lycopene cyclase domain-containing protein [Aquimarina sp. BL5]AXT50694.1 lycopene cyclase domain-containing protein [Aquimarina sp. BL5]RKM94207.1 lycopene cyclase domain-containing protein [Aquimarina sp. BL5]
MSLYLIILVISLAGPLALSFEKNLKLYKRWKYLLPAILITMIIFVTWDIIFTHIGCWFFNPIYNSGIYINKLPLEEYLFFIAIPYACAFSFYAVQFHFPKFKLNEKWTKVLTFLIVIGSVITSLLHQDLTYTFVNFLVLPAILLLSYYFSREVVQHYLAIYPILLIPFFIINGILTGTGIEQAVFDYNPQVILGIHIFSIPLEDMFYNFSLLLSPLALTHIFEMRFKKTKRV